MGLNLVFLVPDETGGMEIYARHLIESLGRVRPDIRLTAFINRNAVGKPGPWNDIESVTVPVNSRNRVAWVLADQLLVPPLARRARVDLLHSPANIAPGWGGPYRRMITVHDLIHKTFPEAHEGLRARAIGVIMPLGDPPLASRDRGLARHARRPREPAARARGQDRRDPAGARRAAPRAGAARGRGAAVARPGRPPRGAQRLRQAPAQEPRAAARRRRAHPGRAAARCSSSPATPPGTRPSSRSTRAGSASSTTCACSAGSARRSSRASMRWPPASCSRRSTRASACRCSRRCSAACRWPARARRSLPEVAGDAALLFDPESTEEIAAAMERLLADGEEAERLRAAGLERARRFTWDETARAHRRGLRPRAVPVGGGRRCRASGRATAAWRCGRTSRRWTRAAAGRLVHAQDRVGQVAGSADGAMNPFTPSSTSSVAALSPSRTTTLGVPCAADSTTTSP